LRSAATSLLVRRSPVVCAWIVSMPESEP
jgi:hypothetical protein